MNRKPVTAVAPRPATRPTRGHTLNHSEAVAAPRTGPRRGHTLNHNECL